MLPFESSKLVKMSTPQNNRSLINIKFSRAFIQMFFSFGNFPSKSMTAQSTTLLSTNALPDGTDTLPSFNGIEFAILVFLSYDFKN